MNSFQTPLANDIDATDGKSKYDTQVKKVLANRVILAWILKYTMKELANVEISHIEKCIESNIEVATVPLEPGLTNLSVITGSTNESTIISKKFTLSGFVWTLMEILKTLLWNII